jgi:hypothetical protein
MVCFMATTSNAAARPRCVVINAQIKFTQGIDVILKIKLKMTKLTSSLTTHQFPGCYS